MSNKQPLEGLTVRIFDPPSDKDEGTKGSRGYREYTEQIGSDKLKYQAHNWNSKKADSEGLQKSTRDWEKDTKRLTSVENLPFVSRSDTNDRQSLKNVDLQHELWHCIKNKAGEIKSIEDKKEWDLVVGLLRKLREGVLASQWSEGDYAFAIQVFEMSVDSALKASRYEEFAKSTSGLMSLYKKQNHHKPFYITLDILYQCCYRRDLNLALQHAAYLDPNTNEGIFVKQILKALLTNNAILYFRLYHNNPYKAFKLLMDTNSDTIRKNAISMLRKAYLSAPIVWIGRWLGIYHDNAIVLQEMDRLVQPSCIKSVDYDKQIVHFSKR